MQVTEIRERLLAKPEAVEDFPFGPEVAVFRLHGKMFALLGLDNNGTPRINLKCDPEESLILRDLFPAVIPGYHMNKKHWNTVILDGSLPVREVQRMIDNSWFLVFTGLKRSMRERLEARSGQKPEYTPF
ncbi:MAG TPA: MmcQ/YjbR family DNA-binding protein [Gammaproteobacteria bacterium]|nr:MmcQ/YjbR family DNA-binding protein [Gammaproteobacteria bacterium]